MIVPPTKFRLSVISPVAFDRTLLMRTPKTENITENPRTKNTVFRMMLSLLTGKTELEVVPPLLLLFELSSVTVVPEMYARKAGIIGSMHGATNELRPASSATRTVTSAMKSIPDFSFKTFFHICTKNLQSVFIWDCVSFHMNKRFIIVGIALGIVITIAVIVGSPAIGGFDSMR